MSKVDWVLQRDGTVRPDPLPTEEQLFADDGPHRVMVRKAGGDWEHVGTRRNIYLAMEYANTLTPRPHAIKVVTSHTD